jgi:hypothetical protein
MKLVERARANVTPPYVHIGFRVHRTNGRERTGTVWWAEWCWKGEQGSMTLKPRIKSEAIEAARALAVELRTAATSPVRSPDPTIAVIGDAYIDYQTNRGHAPKTIEKYRLVLKTLVTWAKGASVRRARDMNEERYWAFHRWMIDDGFSHKTRYDRLIVLKQMFKWAARTRLISDDPLAAAELIRKPGPTPQPCFTPEQVGELLARAKAEDRTVFAMMAYAGLRFGEARDLQWSDLRFDRGSGGFIHVLRGGSGGTRRSRGVHA